jgi:hypothetical protein
MRRSSRAWRSLFEPVSICFQRLAQIEEPNTRALDGSDANGPYAYARVRYLSQQFVEELCSSNGLTDGLLGETVRV